MFDAFDPYVRALEQLIEGPSSSAAGEFAPHLDGEAGRRLRDVASIDDLRRAGAFFTGEDLATKLIAHIPDEVVEFSDPACGCGDLLLAASSRLPVKPSLEATLLHWNRHLSGRDLVPAFVRAARARLVMAAIVRGALPSSKLQKPTSLLGSIAVGDGTRLGPKKGSALLLNPPYGRVAAPSKCNWTSGKTTEAAVFLDKLLNACPTGVHLAALLPEVIRSGSRYGRFRHHVESKLNIKAVEPAGLFDASTDVDVFLLTGETREQDQRDEPFNWVPLAPDASLGDIAEVRVGSVVANRDPKRGPWRLYLEARDISSKNQFRPMRRRRFEGTVFEPPFVVVGRTNRANRTRGPRLQAAIVDADQPIAVENHLMIISPSTSTMSACKDVVELLESNAASEYLDKRLRCRHLTVGALKEIPR